MRNPFVTLTAGDSGASVICTLDVERTRFHRSREICICLLCVSLLLCVSSLAQSQEPPEKVPPEVTKSDAPREQALEPRAEAKPAQAAPTELYKLGKLLIFEGGAIGWVIIALSVVLVALIIEHLLSFRPSVLMPRGVAEELHRDVTAGNFKQAEEHCKAHRSYLSYVVAAGVTEAQLGYSAIEKAMEDASQQQAARLYRKLEYYTVIGTIAPMLGLLGTVWGMIEAFMEFEKKVNPQVSELAPGIYKALVTTFQGLCVAIPALAIYAILRNRVDELVAQTTLLAEHVFSGYRRKRAKKREHHDVPEGGTA